MRMADLDLQNIRRFTKSQDRPTLGVNCINWNKKSNSYKLHNCTIYEICVKQMFRPTLKSFLL